MYIPVKPWDSLEKVVVAKQLLEELFLRLEEPTDGQMIYKGRDIKMNAEELRSFRKEVQIIFQDPYSSLNPQDDYW